MARKWCCLAGPKLYVFKSEDSNGADNVIPIDNCDIVPHLIATQHSKLTGQKYFAIRITHPYRGELDLIIGTKYDLDEWVYNLRSSAGLKSRHFCLGWECQTDTSKIDNAAWKISGSGILSVFAGDEAVVIIMVPETVADCVDESCFMVLLKDSMGCIFELDVQSTSDAGAYICRYMATLAGKYILSILLKNRHYEPFPNTNNGTWYPNILPALTQSDKVSVVQIPNETPSEGLIRFKIAAHDRYRNPQRHQDDSIVVRTEEGSVYVVKSVTSDASSNPNGTYMCSLDLRDDIKQMRKQLIQRGKLVDLGKLPPCVVSIWCNDMLVHGSPFSFKALNQEAKRPPTKNEYVVRLKQKAAEIKRNRKKPPPQKKVQQPVRVEQVATVAPSNSLLRNQRKSSNMFMPHRPTGFQATNSVWQPTIAEYVRRSYCSKRFISPFSSLRALKPDIRLPLPQDAMDILEINLLNLATVFCTYRACSRKDLNGAFPDFIFLRDSDVANVVQHYTNIERLKYHICPPEVQSMFSDFDVIPSLVSKAELYDIVESFFRKKSSRKMPRPSAVNPTPPPLQAVGVRLNEQRSLLEQRLYFPEFVELLVEVSFFALGRNGYERLYPDGSMRLAAMMSTWGFGNIDKLRGNLSSKVKGTSIMTRRKQI
jgi:hypothetical protein